MQEQDYQRYQQPRRPEILVLEQKSYRATISLGFLVWALVLLSLVFVVRIPTFLKRDDFGGIAQIAADVSAICLALFTLVHTLRPKNHYLKLALAALSLDFVLATLLSVLALATTDISVVEPFRQTLTMAIMIVVLAGLSVAGAVSADIWFPSIIKKRWLSFTLKIGTSRPRVKVIPRVIDYSVFGVPFMIVILWANPLNFASAALVLVVGGLANLVALSVVFAAQTVRQPQTDEDKLKSTILEILREIHSRRRDEPTSDGPYGMVAIQTLMTELAERQLFRNETAIRILVEEMAQENSIFVEYAYCYVFPTQDDVDSINSVLMPVSLVVTGYTKDNYHEKVFKNCEYTFLCEFLSRATRYPVQVVEAFFLPRAVAVLEQSFDFSLSYQALPGSKSTQFKLYAKSKKIQDRYRQVRSRYSRSPGGDRQIIPYEPHGNEDLFGDPSPIGDSVHGVVTIPLDILELKKDEQCIALLYHGLKQLLDNEFVNTTER